MQGKGFYGEYGGQFVPETLVPAIDELEKAFEKFKADEAAVKRFHHYLNAYAGRPTPIFFAENISRKYGVKIFLKREDLLHTGAHKINNTIGQALIADIMGKKRIIAETGAGQHGVATATACALFGMKAVIYMGAVDVERQQPNVKKMKLLGADVIPVDEGLKTLKDAITAALRDWVASVETTHYMMGTVSGPHPFPEMVGYFQSVIGIEARAQFEEMGILPDTVVACVGGGSNAIGIFRGFLDLPDVKIVGAEAGGKSLKPGDNAASLTIGSAGIFQGTHTYVIQNREGQIEDVHSVSAGLDYAGIGPEHAYLKDTGRVRYEAVFDEQALRAFFELTRLEGIFPALESSHALAWVLDNAKSLQGKTVLVNLSGRGDKDFGIIEKNMPEGI